MPVPGVRASITTWLCGNSTSDEIEAIRSSDSSDNPSKIGTVAKGGQLVGLSARHPVDDNGRNDPYG